MAKKRTIRTIPQERTPMREQDPTGAGEELRGSGLRLHASRTRCASPSAACMCPDEPCIAGCPVGIDIPGFIQKIGEKNLRGAYDILTDTNLLPSICGRVCPQESQCEGVCTVGDSLEPVAIGRLERFVGDTAIAEGWVNIPYIEPNRFRVGIVGSGPAGMACAADMAKAGCDVTVYEAFHEPGGVLRYGIPDFRLPNEVIDAEIDNLKKLGVKFECNTLVGPPVHHRADDRRDGLPRRVRRRRRRLSDDARHPGRFAERRALGQRAADALQPDARARLPELRHAAADRPPRGRGRRRQHGDGRDARRHPPGRGEGVLHLPALAHRGAGAGRGSCITPSRKACEFHWLTARWRSWTTAGQRARHALRAHGTGRARRLGPPPPGAGGGQRVRFRDRPDRVRDRHQRQSDHGPDLDARAQQVGLHRHRRQPGHLGGGRLRRRRHRHRRRDRDRGHGRGPQGRAQHEGLPGHPRSRRGPIADAEDDAGTLFGDRHARAQFRARRA